MRAPTSGCGSGWLQVAAGLWHRINVQDGVGPLSEGRWKEAETEHVPMTRISLTLRAQSLGAGARAENTTLPSWALALLVSPLGIE